MQEKTTHIYDKLSRFYDVIFYCLTPGHKRVGKFLAEQKIGNVLEVGVGTGLTFKHYPQGTQLTAVDMSSGMLEGARKRKEERPDMKIELMQMDALNLQFADESFDCCYAPSLLTVVPHPEQLIKEMIRVTKPGGFVIFVSHFEGERWQDNTFSKVAAPLTKRLFGFRMDLKLRLFEQLESVEGVLKQKVNRVGPYHLSHLVILKRK